MKRYTAELIGTFALVFCGTGAVIINDVSGGAIGHTGIALTFGLIVMSMIYALGDISGAHINPAVSVAFWSAGRFPTRDLLPYVISQVAGAILASALLKFLFPQHFNLGMTVPAGSDIKAFVLETVLTFILMFVIINASTGAKEKGITAGIAVGSVVALEAMFAGPVTGASMNPARSLAPALFSWRFNSLFIYIIAPVVGAYLGILGCKGVKEKGCCGRPDFSCNRLDEVRK